MISNLQQLYHDQLRDLYSAESQLITALPEMAANATDTDLREAFSSHLEETHNQRDRIVRICSELAIDPAGEECEAMRGLIREAKKHIANSTPGDVRDAVLIASANRVEHYEIAAYGVARAFAEALGYENAVDLLNESIHEEGEADRVLTRIATGGLFSRGVNQEAIH
ncbi:MAG TPA: ferritin-like domain-containing protein [Luteolibacter sp.]|nr:ferritin-like domain-containing protein [Luteolibacter sp.]